MSRATASPRLEAATARGDERGGVLLLVLWLTAALSFVGLSMAMAARTELSATSYRVGAEQARFLARGAVEQTLYAMKTRIAGPDDKPLFDTEKGLVAYRFQTGEARVVFRPEGSLLSVNYARPEQLRMVLQAVGADERQAAEITEAIIDWRTPLTSSLPTAFDRFYAELAQPYKAGHQSFVRLEQLLLVRGMTPELFYGVLQRDSEGRLVKYGGLARLLTVLASGIPSLNDSPYEVLLTVPEMRPEQARAIVNGRSQRRYKTMDDLPLTLSERARQNVTLAGDYRMIRMEATARADGSAATASVRAVYIPDVSQPAFFRLAEWQEQTAGQEFFDSLLSAN